MTLEEFAAVLEASGLPVTYRAWPEGQAPALPFICYLAPGTGVLPADGGVYYSWEEVEVELYTALVSKAAEAALEAALAGFTWEKDRVYIEAERCYKTRYGVTV